MDLDVHHDRAQRKFYALLDGHEAKIEYAESWTDAGCVLDLRHTFVDPALRGRGVAQALAARTLAMARQEGVKIIPTCPFLKSFLQKHPEAGEDLLLHPTA